MNAPHGSQVLLDSVAANVRRLRTRKGFTQEKLAEAADIDIRQLSRIETARSNFAISDLYSLATALGVRPAELLRSRRLPPPQRGRPAQRRQR